MSIKEASARSTRHTFALFFVTLMGGAGIFALATFKLPSLFAVSYTDPTIVATSSPAAVGSTTPALTPVLHLQTPEPLRAIYMTQCVVGTPSFRDSLVRFIESTELNAVVIDIKDFSGGIAFPTENPLLSWAVSKQCGARDMAAFIERLHEKNIYVIGRITVFQDPLYTSVYPEQAVQRVSVGSTTQMSVWKDYKGLSFVDVGARAFWDYIVELSQESYALGFDELNYDYIRYPSDGPMSEAVFTYNEGKSKTQVLEEFFQYLTPKVRATGAVLSADLFGMTATNVDDLNIGQVLERALPYFDGVYLMVYPSHYPKTFHGFADPNEHPYEIVRYAMETAIARTRAATTTVPALAHQAIVHTEVVPARDGMATTTRQIPTGLYKKQVYPKEKIRPWLQSFDYPVTYTPEMVEAQIRAAYDAGLDSWLVWDAANRYNALREILAQ